MSDERLFTLFTSNHKIMRPRVQNMEPFAAAHYNLWARLTSSILVESTNSLLLSNLAILEYKCGVPYEAGNP